MQSRNKEARKLESVATRDNQTREHESNEQYNMEYISPLKVPDYVKKEGYSYAWVNSGINGDNFNVESMAKKHWTLVPADRAPHLSLDPLGRNPISKDYISYKDVVLMERPSIYCDQEAKVQAEYNKEKLKSLSGVSDQMQGFTHTTISTEAL